MKNEAKDKALKQHKKLRETLLNALNNNEMTEETYKRIWNEVAFLRCKINDINACEGKPDSDTSGGLHLADVTPQMELLCEFHDWLADFDNETKIKITVDAFLRDKQSR